MLEKILTKMKEQREKNSNVSDRSLQDLASTYAAIITTDEQLEGMDFTPAIKTIDGNINNYTAEAVKKATKSSGTQPPAPNNGASQDPNPGNPTPEKPDDTPAWAKSIMEQNQKLSESVLQLQKEKETTGRLEQLNTVLKDTPEFFRKPIVSAFNKAQFQNDDEFSNYLDEVKGIRKDFEQQAQEQGMNIQTPGEAKATKPDGRTPILADAMELVKKSNNDKKE